MPSISIDLPKTKHGYEVRADEVFWVAQGVLRSTDLRDSEDEQCIADTVACIIGQDLLDRSKAALDAVYDDTNTEFTRIETALDLYGAEKVLDEFKFVLGEIERICAEGGATKLRDLLFEPKTSNAFPSVFTVIFLAIFECGVSQGKRISDYSGLKISLKGINKRIPVGQKGSNKTERRTNIDVVKGIISKFFVDDPDLAQMVFSNHKIVDIDVDIRRSEIELAYYELKQGLLPLQAGAKDPTPMLDKILRTICAIANNGPKTVGKILIGVADKEADIKKVSEIDGVAGKVIGKRTVVGVCREAKRLGKSLEDYVQILVKHIKTSNISEHTKGAVLLSSYTTRHGRELLIFGVETTGEMDSEHGLIPCKDFVHDQLFSRRSAEDANPTCASGQDPS